MPLNLNLINDSSQIDSINSITVMVAVPLLYVFMTHYLFQALLKLKNDPDKKPRMDDQGKRLFLYGIAGLLSMNFLQYSVFMAIMAWATLICVIINHCLVFLRQIQEKYINYGMLVYYSLLLLWYMGIIFLYIISTIN